MLVVRRLETRSEDARRPLAFRLGHATAAAGHSSTCRPLSNGLSKGPKISVTGHPSKKRPRSSASGAYQDDLPNDPCFVPWRVGLNRRKGLLDPLNGQAMRRSLLRLNPANADTIRDRGDHDHGPRLARAPGRFAVVPEAGTIPIGQHGS